MPSKSKDQAKFMTANCKSPEFRKKTGMSKDVACDFHKADKGKYHEAEEISRLKELAGLEEIMSRQNALELADVAMRNRSPIPKAVQTALDYYEKNGMEEDGADPHGGSMISPYNDEPSSIDVDDAYNYVEDYLDIFVQEEMSQAYIADLADPTIPPHKKAGLTHDFVSDATGYIVNRLDDQGMAYLHDEEIKKFVTDKFREKGIIEGVEMDEKKLEERKLVHSIKTEDGGKPDTRSSDIKRMMKLAGLNKRLDADKEDGNVNFDGVFTGVARGEIDVHEETEFDFLRSLEETKDEEIDEVKDEEISEDAESYLANKDKAIKERIAADSKKEEIDEIDDEEVDEASGHRPNSVEDKMIARLSRKEDGKGEYDDGSSGKPGKERKRDQYDDMAKRHNLESNEIDELKVSRDNPPTDVPVRRDPRDRSGAPDEISSRYGMPSGVNLDDYAEVSKVEFNDFVTGQGLEQRTQDKPDRLNRTGYGSTAFMYGPSGSDEVHAFIPDEGMAMQPAGTVPYYVRKDLMAPPSREEESIMDDMFRETEHFAEGSMNRYMVEMIVDEMNKGHEVEEIAETLSFDFDHVAHIVEFVKGKNELDELAPASGKKFKGFDDDDDDEDDDKEDTDEAIQDNSFDRMRKLAGMKESKKKISGSKEQ